MKIQQLRYFVTTCKLGSVTRAAAQLHVAQPSVSAAIKELETELSVNLFHRTGNQLMLSGEGKSLLLRAELLVREHDNIVSDMREMAGANRVIRLGLPVQVGSYLLPCIMGEFHRANPDIVIDIVEVGALDTMELIEREHIDMAVFSTDEAPPVKLHYSYLFSSQYCVCMNARHPLAAKNVIDVTELHGKPLALLQKGFHVNRRITELFANSGVQPNIMLQTSQLHTIENLLRHDLALSVLLYEAAETMEGVCAVPLKQALPVRIAIATKADVHLSAAASRLAAFLKEKFRP